MTGRPPEDFETTVRGYVQQPGARRNPYQLARVLATLTRAAVTSGGNPHRTEHRQQDPGPIETHLAIDDPEWIATHSPSVTSR